VLGAALAFRRTPAPDGVLDHTPAHHWPDPVVRGEPSLESGPIMVQVEYQVDAERAGAFRNAMAEMGRNRRRDGAVEWWLFEDTADPSRFVETWIEETWAEHLRYHDRVSIAHKELEEKVRALTQSGSAIATRHFITPDNRRSTKAAERAVEECTRC
jgi:quinol monooxygenase YgiN